MALLDSEIQLIKYELGYNVMSIGAIPYIGIVAVFEQVIKPYTLAGATTTSSTTVTSSATPQLVSLTLASATGFSAGDRAVVDVDGRQESATVESVSGSTISVLLSLTHGGTYPVTVEGGESIVRSILRELRNVRDKISKAAGLAGLRKVEDIEFFAGNGRESGSVVDELVRLRGYWRDELASALGVENRNATTGGGGGSFMEVY